MPGRVELKLLLAKIWHAPDHIRLLDPLPLMHRRGVIAGAILVAIGVLLPSGSDNNSAPIAAREAQLDLQSASPSQQPMRAQLVSPADNDSGQVAPVEPEPIQEQEDQSQAQVPSAPQSQPQPGGIAQQWRSWRIEPGKTVAQLFRDHNLPPADVYAMAQVEGSDKPLSNLQNGQMIQVRQNASGVVTGLSIDLGNGQQALFTRQSDGSFIRSR